MNNNGRLIVISGPSGVGKGTIAKVLGNEDGFYLSVSRTTRAPRENETEGADYYFTSRAEFERLIAQNGFFEYAEYNGNYYGTPLENIDKNIEKGLNVILEIEVNGASKIRNTHKRDFIGIFLIPPSVAEMKNRLQTRGTETDDNIKKRLKIARAELEAAGLYNYLVVNDTVNRAVSEIKAIVEAERLKMAGRECILQKLKEEF